ncbi:hypothetical protein GBA52_009627 [Prunus armeniaca]|nr:hypothetical protein GBA52_009627 [Prunus armeniaca]
MASVTWEVVIVGILAMVATKYVQDYYLASARELIRINGTTKAPVMNYASETSLGVVTIRAFKMKDSLSNYIISVERINQFMKIAPEPPAIVEDKRPASSWPPKGRIELHSLEIKHHPNAPLVLKGITCTFKEGTRVGVVGRTGSGKTTLISALFRLVEPASGKIIIDGLDISSMGLKDLRMKLSIIPQEPTLFRGSIRTNLDPLGLYSDDEIWRVRKNQLQF